MDQRSEKPWIKQAGKGGGTSRTRAPVHKFRADGLQAPTLGALQGVTQRPLGEAEWTDRTEEGCQVPASGCGSASCTRPGREAKDAAPSCRCQGDLVPLTTFRIYSITTSMISFPTV